MSDEELRAQRRAAEETDDAASWLRFAQTAARAGHGDEAGLAAERARAKGGDAAEVLDALAPASLEAFAPRELGKRFELGKLWFTGWSPDARTVYAIENKRALLAIEAATGNRRTIAALPGDATAFAVGLDGAKLALGLVVPENRKLVNVLAVVDAASGALERVGRGHQWIHQVALASDSILAGEGQRVRGYRLGDEKSFISLKGRPALDRTGAFAVTMGRDLHLHASFAEEPRVTVGLDVTPEQLARFHLACAGERLLVVAEDVVLLEKTGAIRARAKLPSTNAVYDALPSPSGRHVAIFYFENNQRTTRFDLVDLTTGQARGVDLGARPREASWSLSGQRLAIPTDQGTIVLLEALGDGAKQEVAKPTTDEGWVELRSSQRFWRARKYGALVEFHHGGLGTRGVRGATPCLDEAEAGRELARRIQEKEKDGYRRV